MNAGPRGNLVQKRPFHLQFHLPLRKQCWFRYQRAYTTHLISPCSIFYKNCLPAEWKVPGYLKFAESFPSTPRILRSNLPARSFHFSVIYNSPLQKEPTALSTSRSFCEKNIRSQHILSESVERDQDSLWNAGVSSYTFEWKRRRK